MIKAAIISYNDIYPYTTMAIETIKGIDVLILPNTFNDEHLPKSPQSVSKKHPNWIELMKHYETLEVIGIFLGKKPSGSNEIAEQSVAEFIEKKECLRYVACDHDLFEKLTLLAELGIAKEQIVIFSDAYTQCQESPWLWGLVYDYINHLIYDEKYQTVMN